VPVDTCSSAVRQRTGAGERVGDGHGDEDAVGPGAHVTAQQDGADESVGDDRQDDDERRDDAVDDEFDASQSDVVRPAVSHVRHGACAPGVRSPGRSYRTTVRSRLADTSTARRSCQLQRQVAARPHCCSKGVIDLSKPVSDSILKPVYTFVGTNDVTSALSLSTFRRHLKTYLFRCCYNTAFTYSGYRGPRGGVAA